MAFGVIFWTCAQAQTIVKGKITNPKGKLTRLTYWDGEQKSLETTLAKDGTFRFQLYLQHPQAIDLEHGDERTGMFLFPHDSIYVTLDTKMFDETVTYSGKGAEANNFLAKQLLHFETSIGSMDFVQTYYRKIAFSDAAEFCAYADSLASIKLNYLNQFRTQLPVAFYDYQYAEIVYDYATDKADYPSMHYYVRGIEDSTVTVDPSFYHFYDELPVDNENYLASYNFVSYLGYYIRKEAQLNFGRDSVSFIDQLVAARFLLKGKIKEKAIYELVSRGLDYGPANEMKAVYQMVSNDIQNTELRETLDNKYKLVSSLMPGNPAPNIALKTKDGKLVNLSDFKGKVVFLDFWASWCGPCMMEMPHAKILQDTFAGKDVVFLYVSIDEDEKAWIKTMESKKMKGVHIRANGFNDAIVKRYSVNGIPSYYLIGKDGNIINNNPSRPSNPKVYAEIEEALHPN
jgi:thiol-disulfide isomerase/thioredoxin